MSSTRRALPVVTALSLLAGGGLLVHATSGPARQPVAEPRLTADARFLRLTDQGSAAWAGADRRTAGSTAAATTKLAACATSRTTVAMLPNGWCLSPAGKQVGVLRFPLGAVATSNGKVVVTSNSGGVQGLTVVDAQTLQTSTVPAANLFMGVAETPDGRVLASGGNADRVYRYRWAGGTLVGEDVVQDATAPLSGPRAVLGSRTGLPLPALPVSDGVPVTSYPGNIVRYGRYLLVAGTLSEASQGACPGKQPACGRVSVLDATTDTVVARVPVGLDAYGIAVDPARRRAYVSNWADEAGRGRGTGTVSVVDLANPLKPREVAVVRVGHHPSAVQLSADRTRLFVTNTNDDSLSVVDVTRTPRVVATESLRPVEGLPVGAHPDALALAPDGRTLFVALAGLNAVEVRDGRTGARVAGHPVYLPTGWYPSALAITGNAKHYRLWVTNAKGTGPGAGYNGSVFLNGSASNGSVSVVDLPVPAATANRWTQQVVGNDALDAVSASPCARDRGVRVSQVICPPSGRRSPIRHVVYVVTENKTFDQYFGDLPSGEGAYRADPSYVLYGEQVTPNHHAIASSYSLGDNFFSDAEVSVTGHSWTSGADATDHNEKTWQADYDQGVRGTHGNNDPLKGGIGGSQGTAIQDAEDELNDPEGGYVFEAFRRAGATPPSDRPGRLSMAIYGEHTARTSGNMDAYKAPGWKDGDIAYSDTCRVLSFRDGVTPDGPSPAFSAGSPPAGVATDDCNGRKLASAFTLKHWVDVYNKTGRDIMPSFIYMSLPQNHTLATTVGNPTPQSMVADNDYALGLLVQSLSRTPFWASTAVMQTEDDTQVAGDHISALRDYLLVASPWARKGPDHQWGSMPALLRTIEQLFGVRPVSLFDRLAMPMHEAFLPSLSNRPDLRPFSAVPSRVPFDVNQPDAVGSALSATFDFTTWDRVDEQLLNAILYADARHQPLRLPDR